MTPRKPAAPLVVLLLTAAVTCTGCLRSATYIFRDPTRPIKAREVRMDPAERRECLLVMIPGLFDIPDQFFEEGFVRATRRASDRCDFVVVDANLSYYQRGIIRDVLEEDVLRIAQARGYDEIWLIGISMGGLGALLLAEAHPDEIEGVMLLSPWLGDQRVVQSVAEAGGLAAWDPPPESAGGRELADASTQVLRWLRDRDDDAPVVFVGVGEDDQWRSNAALVSEAVPPERSFTAPGGHNWATWRTLWSRMLAVAPWAR